MDLLAWGRRVSPAFRTRVPAIVASMGGITPSDLMACIAWETGGTFSPSVRNAAGSGAVGLIQFMPQTAALLGTSIEALARMTAEDQLSYVARYFAPMRGRLRNLGDLYCAILWPSGIGKADTDVLFTEGGARPALYLQNRGLDINHNGAVTRGEVIAKVKAQLALGLLPANAA